MTDERLGDALWPTLWALPPGSGVVLRHHRTPAAERRALIRRVMRLAAARQLVLVVAGGWPGAGTHGSTRGGTRGGTQGGPKCAGLRTWPAHDRRQAIAGERAGAQVLFVSPVFPTRSHPGAPALGIARAARIGRGLGVATVALGGMTPRRFLRCRRWGFTGWAAIDALARTRQKRKAVPI